MVVCQFLFYMILYFPEIQRDITLNNYSILTDVNILILELYTVVLSGLNTDGSFTTAVSNLFLSP